MKSSLIPDSPPTKLSTPDLSKLSLSTSCPDLKAESIVSDDSDSEGEPSPLSVDHIEKASEVPPQAATSGVATRRKLQWTFKGLTLWLELEEFNNDLTKAVADFSSKHSSPVIPKPHTTAIYGMEHLTEDEAKARLAKVRSRIPTWPRFSRPTGIQSDIAVCGKPGQVCSIAWSELTLATNEEHERALDSLHELFFGHDFRRDRPWKPHNSIAYDNPETNKLSLLDTVSYVSQNPSLLGKERRVEAISLWNTVGKMEKWTCIDRVRFW